MSNHTYEKIDRKQGEKERKQQEKDKEAQTPVSDLSKFSLSDLV